MIVVNEDQPWAFAVCHHGCDVLNMNQPVPDSHGPLGRAIAQALGASVPVEPLRVLLRAGDNWDDCFNVEATSDLRMQWAQLGDITVIGRRRHDGSGEVYLMGPGGVSQQASQPFGAVVAVVEITGCHEAIEHVGHRPEHTHWCCESPWAQRHDIADGGVWHWTVGEVTVLPTPIPTPLPHRFGHSYFGRAPGRGRSHHSKVCDCRVWAADADLVAAVEEQTG